MFITKMSLPRRTFLRGMGVTVALPLLEAMVPAATALARTPASASRLRFGAIYIPHGAIMNQWTPSTVGSGFEFTPILKPLEAHKDHVVVVTNLARPGGELTASHAPTAAGWLSGAIAKRTEAEDVRLGTTLDQIVAKEIGQETPFPSLELATENFTGYIGACSTGYSCAYMSTLAWSTPTTPLPTEIDPRVVFERLFGRAGSSAQRLARQQENRSILDSIASEAGQLNRVLGVRDRQRLSEYLDNVREIERRIQRAESQNTAEVKLDAPVGVPDSYAEYAGVMFDMMAVAYQADLTRVITFMMGREASNRTYPELGITLGHHELSHHGNKPEGIAQHAQLNAFHLQQFAKFVGTLKATPDGDGSLLDHMLMFYGSGMSNGNVHSPDPLPLLAVGGGAGRGHRHIEAAPKTQVGNMWLSVAHKFGSTVGVIGESNGTVSL
jgi:hypothetical protein